MALHFPNPNDALSHTYLSGNQHLDYKFVSLRSINVNIQSILILGNEYPTTFLTHSAAVDAFTETITNQGKDWETRVYHVQNGYISMYNQLFNMLSTALKEVPVEYIPGAFKDILINLKDALIFFNNSNFDSSTYMDMLAYHRAFQAKLRDFLLIEYIKIHTNHFVNYTINYVPLILAYLQDEALQKDTCLVFSYIMDDLTKQLFDLNVVYNYTKPNTQIIITNRTPSRLLRLSLDKEKLNGLIIFDLYKAQTTLKQIGLI